MDFAGSAIALFGCPEPMTLDIIEKIELGENLPHPMLDGVWIKRSEFPGEAYLLNEGDPVKSLKYAKECGFRLVHIGDIFKTWGHFDYSSERFKGGLKDIRAAVDEARKDGISMGVHTLTMFTQKNDAYITPVPSDSLCKTGSSVLSKETGKTDQEIFVQEPDYFRYAGLTHTVKIGKELINYRKVSDNEPCDCSTASVDNMAQMQFPILQIHLLTSLQTTAMPDSTPIFTFRMSMLYALLRFAMRPESILWISTVMQANRLPDMAVMALQGSLTSGIRTLTVTG